MWRSTLLALISTTFRGKPSLNSNLNCPKPTNSSHHDESSECVGLSRWLCLLDNVVKQEVKDVSAIHFRTIATSTEAEGSMALILATTLDQCILLVRIREISHTTDDSKQHMLMQSPRLMREG